MSTQRIETPLLTTVCVVCGYRGGEHRIYPRCNGVLASVPADQFTYPWGPDWKRHYRVPAPLYKKRRFRRDVSRMLDRVIKQKPLSEWDTNEDQLRLF